MASSGPISVRRAGLSEIGVLPTYAEARHLASHKEGLRQRAWEEVQSQYSFGIITQPLPYTN